MRDAAQELSVIKRAIEAVGGPTALAAAIGVKMPSLYSWRRVPAERVLAVEKATGIPRQELRPDLYPPEIAAADAPRDAA